MSKKRQITLLVGDNPFHGISHLSQQRSRDRDKMIEQTEYDASLVLTSVQNGAGGFMFSVSETTLSILRAIQKQRRHLEGKNLQLYAIVPYAYEYVRMATQAGGMTGVARQVAKRILMSGNVRAMITGMKGFATMDTKSLLETYLLYEIARIKSSAGKNSILHSLLLHEIITEIGLSLNLDWLFKSFIDFTSRRHIMPGFETRNFACLVKKFQEWNLDFRQVVIATPFNKVGFQMNPSKTECESALIKTQESNVIAMSVLAAGYLRPHEAVEYLSTLKNLKGIVVGVSKEHHARDTFRLFRETLA